MDAARDRVPALEGRRADHEARPVGFGERREEERRAGRRGRDQPRAALDLVRRGRLVDRHLDVHLAAAADRGGEAGLVLVPAGALARVARALDVEADDRDPGQHAREPRGQDARGLEEQRERRPAPGEPRDQELGLRERLAARDRERVERGRSGGEPPDHLVERIRRQRVRAALYAVGTEDAARGGRHEALRRVTVPAAERTPAEADEELPATGVEALALERHEDLGDVPHAGGHATPYHASRRATTRSATFVPVGPVRRRSPVASRSGWLSVAASARAGSTPRAAARAGVSPSTHAPAASVGPSTPSVPAARTTAGAPARATAAASASRRERPPRPPAPTCTVVSPPATTAAGRDRGAAASRTAIARPASAASPRSGSPTTSVA